MLPVVDREGSRTFRQILVTAVVLVGVSLLPAIAGLPEGFTFLGRWRLAWPSAGLRMGRQREDKFSGQVAHARYRYIHPAVARPDGLRQNLR